MRNKDWIDDVHFRDGFVVVQGHCVVTQRSVRVICDRLGFSDWDYGNGEYIQECLPKLSLSDRERLITGLGKEIQDEIFDAS